MRIAHRALLAGRICGCVALAPVAGCAGFGGGWGEDVSPGAEAGQPASGPTMSGAEVNVMKGTPAGDVVADADGYTLYLSTTDSTDPPTAQCEGDCARRWPPAVVEGEASAEGVAEDLVGRVERTDGATQLTLDDWPLYRFSGDVSPGDVNGHGADGIWFAVTPDGDRAGGGSGASTERTTPGDTGHNHRI